MKKAHLGRNIMFVTLAAILCGSAALTAYASNVKGQNTEIFTEKEKPILPQSEQKTMFGRQYTLEEAGIDNRMTDIDKVKAINDYLCEKLEYADYAAEEGFSYKEDWLPFTDYCLLSDAAVCSGYAEAFQSMCISAGIECYYVTGYLYQNGSTEGIYHAWNRVNLNEKSYYIDVCRNDNSDGAYFMSANGWDDHAVEQEQETYQISGQVFPMPEYIHTQLFP